MSDRSETNAPTDDSQRDALSVSDPEQLRDREGVEVVEGTRTFDPETFEGLRRRYDAIEGVVQVGITSEDGDVLLLGPDGWAPLGGDVELGENWTSAARRTMEKFLGVSIEIESVERVEFTDFCLEDQEDERFRADSVFFRASVVDAPEFVADPTIPEDVEHKYFSTTEDLELAWFDEVTDEVLENHRDHVRLFLDGE